ncbi:MAG: DHHA1 domain-containing protein [Desulfobacterales bacterium]
MNGNAVTVKKKGSQYHVSLRSDGAVNVAAIATSFGGGGHQNAAGFDIQATLPELKRTIFYFSKNL